MRPTKRARKAGSYRPAMPRSIVPNTYRFTRTCKQLHTYYSGGWVDSAQNVLYNLTSTPAGIFRFKLSDLPDYTEFTNLYEQFRISKVILRFLPVQGTDAEVASSSRIIPLAVAPNVSAIDTVAAAVGLSDVLSEQGCRLLSGERPYTMTVYPKAYGTVDGVSTASSYGGWLNSNGNGSSVEHMGFKWAWELPTASAISGYSVYATFVVECRNPK